MVSPTNTGAVSWILSQPRLAIAFWLRSETLMPTTMESVRQLLTSGLPNSLLAAYSLSKCRGFWFMVMSVNQVLSVSVMLRPGRCS